MSFGVKLKTLREAKGDRQEDIGKMFSVSKSAVSQWESDIRTPDTDIIVKLANYFNVTTDYLLGREPKQEYKIKEARFPYLAQEYPNINVDRYILDIREAIGKAVTDGKISPEQVEDVVQEMTRYLMFQIEELKNKDK